MVRVDTIIFAHIFLKHIIYQTEKQNLFKIFSKLDDKARNLYSDNDDERPQSDIIKLFTDHKNVVLVSNIEEYIEDAGNCEVIILTPDHEANSNDFNETILLGEGNLFECRMLLSTTDLSATK